ncbi:MAG: AMP-dependent synthetase/ligase [Nocardiopsaceae bacterium]|jgi:long-chain acyl-CoA synthetase|nr:AMP-dependent synthetase/ligase [Nocardiopsaceae bacterium]
MAGGPLREFSIPALAEIPAEATLTDVVFDRPAQTPETVIMRRREAVADNTDGGHTWTDVTAAQFRDEVRSLAKGILAAGIRPGDRVGLMARTSYAWTLIDYAIWTTGAVTVPVYETSSPDQVEWILSDSGCRGVFAETEAHAAAITSVKGNLPELVNIWLMDTIDVVTAAGGDITDDELNTRMAGRTADDLATIIYTSGTTGRPKGCELTHRNLLSGGRNAVQGALHELFDIAGSSTLLFLPLAHSFARIIQVACIEGGAVLDHWEDAATLAHALPEAKPVFLLAVPRVFEKVFNSAQQQAAASAAKSRIFRMASDTAIAFSRAQPAAKAGSVSGGPGQVLKIRHALFDRLVYAKLRAAVGGKVVFAVSGGAPLGERLGHFFRGAGITVLEGYGLTETSAAATVNRPSHNKIGTVGLPIPGTTIRIADDGEILIGGPIVFRGYWRNEEATAEALDVDGWLRTGDIGALDDEGFLSVTGRKKELIVTAGGKNVAPAVLEDRLRAHPLVSQTMVVGDNRPFVACLITLDAEALDFWKQQHGKPADATSADLAEDPDLIADLQAAVDDANKAVSRAESIRKFRVLTTDFTEASGHLTPSLKVKRSVVSRDFASDIELLYSRG